MLAILVDTFVDILGIVDSMVGMLAMEVISLASVRLKLMLDILVDILVDILATVESILEVIMDMPATMDYLDEFLNRRADTEFLAHDEIHTCHFDLNILDKHSERLKNLLLLKHTTPLILMELDIFENHELN